MDRRVRKAVFPVAGLGTRFLPATKASPKEMLPVVDKPLIQYAAEEAVAAGADLLIFVTGRNKRSIADHFDRAYELEAELAAKGKDDLLALVQGIVPSHVTCAYVRQPDALGLGHAVLCAESLVGNEPFFVILADDLIRTKGLSCCAQLGAAHAETGGSVIAVQEVPAEDTRKYGIVAVGEGRASLAEITAIVEKPNPENAPSRLGVVGRYLLTPGIFRKLHQTSRGAGGEIQLTDAISELIGKESVHALHYEGERFDCGNKLGYLQATVAFGKNHPELGPDFTKWLRSVE